MILRRFYHRLLAPVAALAIALALAPAAAAQEGFVMQVPLAASLEQLAENRTLPLLEFAGGEYALSLSRLDDNGLRWVRMVVARGNYFYGACTLGVWEQLEGLEALRVDAVFQQNRAEFAFTSQPDKQRRGALAMPMSLGGNPALSAFSEGHGIALVYQTGEDDAASAEPGNQLPAKRDGVGAGPYILALGLLVFLLAALILGQLFGRKWLLGLRERRRQLLRLLRNYLKNRAKTRERVIALPPPRIYEHDETPPLMDTSEFRAHPRGAADQDASGPQPREPALVGATIVPAAAQNTLLRRILMREEAPPPPPEQQEDAMRAFFRGRARLPRYQFLTVGLSNRDALLQLGGESVRPLFAPNPRGQLFSLEEESGNLYLHVDYFAPPSFVLQSVLRSVCLERIFTCVDVNGRSILLEEATNRSIAEITPARTVRTEAGFIVTEKGMLMIGKI